MALLPIGLMAVLQTQEVADRGRESAGSALIALTDQAAVQEQLIIENAVGTAGALAAMIPVLIDQGAACSASMREVVSRNREFSFAGFVPRAGLMTCSSGDRVANFSEDPGFDALMADPRPRISLEEDPEFSQFPVVIVSHPVFAPEGGAHLGYASVSVPHRGLFEVIPAENSRWLIDMVTFNADGQVITSRGAEADLTANLPADVALTELVGSESSARTLISGDGKERIYTVTSVTDPQFHLLGIWESDAALGGVAQSQVISGLFPALMWAASLAVSLFAIHRLVTSHLSRLSRQMAAFAARRRLPDEHVHSGAPTEIMRIHKSFLQMTESLLQDEARLENAVREKGVLVKEIHHRVKNNLQLISSIINLQIRGTESAETEAALRRTQDRVLSMATIHQDLYQTSDDGTVNCGPLLREVVKKSLEQEPLSSDLDITLEVKDVRLFPDQAIPLSMLTAEAVTNALRHMPGPEAHKKRWLTLTFTCTADRECALVVANPFLPPLDGAPVPETVGGAGLGRKLIQAFATQLGANVTTRDTDGAYRLELEFTASDFRPAARSY